jgi:hypothetical protein
MIELHPSIIIRGGVNSLLAPPEVAVKAVNDYTEGHRYGLIYICGNRSEVLGSVEGNFDTRKIFTIYQLFSILEEVHHDVIFIEHDPILFEDQTYDLIHNLFLAMKDVASSRTVLYYSSQSDRAFKYIAKNSDRFIYFEKEPGGYFIVDTSLSPVSYRKIYHRFMDRNQLTLEVF